MLNVELYRVGIGVTVIKMTGLTEKELSELNSMDYRDMKEKIVEMLNYRTESGSIWTATNRLYNAYIRDGAVFCEIGKD